MLDVSAILEEALRAETRHLDPPPFDTIGPETNVLEQIDSLTVVNLLLESEMRLEAATGTYVTLADETLFDAKKSPLLKWSDWVRFVEARHGG
ncbi:MAG TPA: hypothetical protein VGM87_16535 [Roseomonas sp.]|jgi:hypothetical protein